MCSNGPYSVILPYQIVFRAYQTTRCHTKQDPILIIRHFQGFVAEATFPVLVGWHLLRTSRGYRSVLHVMWTGALPALCRMHLYIRELKEKGCSPACISEQKLRKLVVEHSWTRLLYLQYVLKVVFIDPFTKLAGSCVLYVCLCKVYQGNQ
jgi:hypothetical protein